MIDLLTYPDWDIDGRDWPHRDASRFIEGDAYQWHVQRKGSGPTVVLLHGAGASTHSWAELMEALIPDHDVVALDLPGHGFTRRLKPAPASLESYAAAVASILTRIDVSPAALIGHSAGAAVMIQMALDGYAAPRLVSINGALRPFAGVAGIVFPAFARLIYLNPAAPHVFAASARDPRRIERLIAQTGSHIGPDALERYRRLLSCSGHISGVLRMMANWDLTTLERKARGLKTPTLFLYGDEDKAAPPSDSIDIASDMPDASLKAFAGSGHLLHEESPDLVASAIRDFLKAGTARTRTRA